MPRETNRHGDGYGFGEGAGPGRDSDHGFGCEPYGDDGGGIGDGSGSPNRLLWDLEETGEGYGEGVGDGVGDPYGDGAGIGAETEGAIAEFEGGNPALRPTEQRGRVYRTKE